jgi:hypothetical protein
MRYVEDKELGLSVSATTPTMEAAPTPVKSTAAAMESTSMESTTAEAVTKPAMLMESTAKTAETATVVGITIAKPIAVGIPIAVGVIIRIVIVVVMVMMFSVSAWRSNKHHHTG